MPAREFDTGFWGNPDVRRLPSLAKLLEAWSFTNDHCLPSGLYEVAPETITFDTGIPREELPDLFKQLEPNVMWYPERNLIWVKNFIKRQTKSLTFLQAAAKALALMNCDDIIQELLKYNQGRFGITIPYEYYCQRFARLSKASSELSRTEPLSRADSFKAENIIDPNFAAIVKCYESNIGIITPIIGEHLKDIADTYPQGWFEKATDEAITSGKRNLKYIKAILERWKAEGVNPLSLKRKRGSGSKPVEEED